MPLAIHICPACQDWQVEVHLDALFSYIAPGTPTQVAVGASHARVEDVLLEHLHDCFGIPDTGPPLLAHDCPSCDGSDPALDRWNEKTQHWYCPAGNDNCCAHPGAVATCGWRP